MTSTEAPFSVTFKPNGDPLFTVRAESEQELEMKLRAIESNGTLATVGRVQKAYDTHYRMGDQLGATMDTQPTNSAPEPDYGAPQGGYGQPEPPQDYGQQPPAYGQPQQQQYGQQQPQYGAPQGGGYGQQPQAPQQGNTHPNQPAGAPMVLGMAAKYVEGKGKTGVWRAWADPRDKSITDRATRKTDNPNDPGLATGEAKFWAWIR